MIGDVYTPHNWFHEVLVAF